MNEVSLSGMARLLGLLAGFGMSLAACDHAPVGEELPVMPELERAELTPSGEAEKASSVSDLPYAKGLTFSTLDAYLEFLERYSTQDKPYYRQLKTGEYVHEVGRQPFGISPTERVYTREELEQKFGFAPSSAQDKNPE